MIIIFLALGTASQSQEMNYDPKGNPDKWNVEITPFLVLPYVSGEVQSELLSEEFGIDPADFLTSLGGTFMMDLALSKGKFFASAGYIYNYNGVEKILWSSENGKHYFTAKPELQRHILDVSAGMRLRLGDKFILDPFAGFRYTYYHLFGEMEGNIAIIEIDEHKDFWDPVLGMQAHYYPHPRVPVELRVDFGGFGAGSEFIWSTWFNSGYTVSPVVDLIAGFAALSNKYESETGSGRTYGMTSITYGFDLGVRFCIPSRGKDPDVFKKAKPE
ncbi:MAG TPA: hypothetical protein PKI34_12460 [Bacteroidales bacterium]|nr:hypothetical protein [Bacteroidales bacterium]